MNGPETKKPGEEYADWKAPETGGENPEVNFNAHLINEKSGGILQKELQSNGRLANLLFAMKEGNLPNAYELQRMDRMGMTRDLIDSQESTDFVSRVFEAKMSMLEYIDQSIGPESGGPQAAKEKRMQYKQAMEGLFRALGMMGPQQEYSRLRYEVGAVRMPRDQKEREAISAQREFYQQRMQELEDDYGIKG